MSLVTLLPLAQGILVTVHFLLSVCGEQVCEGTEAGEVVFGLWTCRRGPRNRDWDPFLKPHVLFFFMQVLHWLHSPSSHSEARWPWGVGGGKKICDKDSASVCFGLKHLLLTFIKYVDSKIIPRQLKGLRSRTDTLHGVIGGALIWWASDVTSPSVWIQALLTFRAKIAIETGFTIFYFTFWKRQGRQERE